MLKPAFPALLLLLVACGERDTPAGSAPTNNAPPEPTSTARSEPAPLTPPAPGQPGGLPDDGTPTSEAPFTEEGAQGAAQVLQTYFALIDAGRYDQAWKLRWKGSGDDAESAEAFARSFDRYAEYHASVGAPGPISGAAGSLFVDVPVQIYGRLKNGEPFATAGTITLRRANNVPGSTAEQRRWRVYVRD